MRVGESIQRGFSTAAGSLPMVLIILAISALFNLATSPLAGKLQLMTAGWSAPGATPPNMQQILAVLPLLSIYLVVSMLLNTAITAGSFGYIHEKIKSGNVAIPVFFVSASKHFLHFLGLVLASLLFGLVFFVVLVLSVMVGALISQIGGGNSGLFIGLGVGIGLLLFIGILLYGLYGFFVLFTLAPYEIVSENAGVMGAIKKSCKLAKANFWALAGLVTVLSLFFLLFAAVAFVIGFIAASATGNAEILQTGPVSIVAGLVLGFAFLFLGFFAKSSLMVFYLGTK